MNAPVSTQLVAITGGSASGKTWLADRLHSLLGANAGRLRQDDFYRDLSQVPPSRRGLVNFDHPNALDWPCFEEVLRNTLAGRPSCLPTYDFRTHCRVAGSAPVRPAPVVIVDGLWLLHRPALRRLFHCRIFLNCPEEERLRRRIARDTAERGRTEADCRRQFSATVAPMHFRFVDPQARWADLVLNFPHAPAELEELHHSLRRLLRGGARISDRVRETFRAGLPSNPRLIPA